MVFVRVDLEMDLRAKSTCNLLVPMSSHHFEVRPATRVHFASAYHITCEADQPTHHRGSFRQLAANPVLHLYLKSTELGLPRPHRSLDLPVGLRYSNRALNHSRLGMSFNAHGLFSMHYCMFLIGFHRYLTSIVP